MATRKAQRIAGTPPSYSLTPRQKEILHLVASGMTNREIANVLDISARTAEVHRFNLMHRLRVRNVAQLLRVAIINGTPRQTAIRPFLRTAHSVGHQATSASTSLTNASRSS